MTYQNKQNVESATIIFEIISCVAMSYRTICPLNDDEGYGNPQNMVWMLIGAILGGLLCTQSLYSREPVLPSARINVDLSYNDLIVLRSMLLIPLCMLVTLEIKNAVQRGTNKCRGMHFSWQGYRAASLTSENDAALVNESELQPSRRPFYEA